MTVYIHFTESVTKKLLCPFMYEKHQKEFWNGRIGYVYHYWG